MLTRLLSLVMPTIHKWVPDKDLARKIEGELKQLDHAEVMAQIAVNLESAKHKSIFVAGARPAVMWATAFQQIVWTGMIADPIYRMMEWGAFSPDPVVQGMNWGILMGTLGLRSWDKKNGVQTDSLGSLINQFIPGGK